MALHGASIKMTYITHQYPFDRHPTEMSDMALKKAFSIVMEQKSQRILSISDHLFKMHGVRITPSSTDDEIDRLPALIGSLGRLKKLTDEQIEFRLTTVKSAMVDAMRELLPTEMPDGETMAMIFDGGLLWGEAFQFRYSGAQWVLAGKPKSSVHYGDPVLIGPIGGKYRPEFDPRLDLLGSVSRILFGKLDGSSLSGIMGKRAVELGLIAPEA